MEQELENCENKKKKEEEDANLALHCTQSDHLTQPLSRHYIVMDNLIIYKDSSDSQLVS